jgi:hypothetical protein
MIYIFSIIRPDTALLAPFIYILIGVAALVIVIIDLLTGENIKNILCRLAMCAVLEAISYLYIF